MYSRIILRFVICLTSSLTVVHGCFKKSVAIEASRYETLAEITENPTKFGQRKVYYETTTLLDLLLEGKSQDANKNTEDNPLRSPKKKTSTYVGLINQGATCYLNSALQMLFFVKSLTKSVFQVPLIPDDQEKKKDDLGLAFQRIFYKLQFGKDAVSTKEFTKALGWGPSDHLEQQDLVEFLIPLFWKLEDIMKNTKVEWDISKLFDGQLEEYINCLNSNCKKRHVSTYTYVSLDVKGKDNIYKSFLYYTQPDQLVGENTYYFDEEYGRQPAEKGRRFKSFPPVLFLQLKRFDYDFDLDRVVKLGSRLEYPVQLNLTQFLHAEEQVNDHDTAYFLQSVLVYMGNGSAGHYVVYSNPACDGQWFRFDDSSVRQATLQEATEDNYGKGNGTTSSVWDESTLAYVLVYIQKSSMGEILKEITLEEIPSALQKRMEAEKVKADIF